MKSTVVIAVLLASLPLFAQSKKDPLNDREIEEVREAGIDPPVRIKLFVGYIDERAKMIHTISSRKSAPGEAVRLHNLLDEFTRLSDDLQDNMDQFDQQHADLRKELKVVGDKTTEWATILNEPPANSEYDFVRKTAIDSNQSAHESAASMITDEEKYFAEQKRLKKEQEKKQSEDEHSR
jgi:hypothetical protein